MNRTLAPTFVGNALATLVEHVQQGRVAAIVASWHGWFEKTMQQLESDDTLDARLVDEIADRLTQVEEALEHGGDAARPLRSLASLLAPQECLESRWARLADSFRWEELQTVTFKDLQKALDAADERRFQPVEAWIERVERRIFNIWEQYELSTVFPEEVTTESVLGHRYLSEGIEGWLEALGGLRSGLRTGVDRESVLARAEAAQRLLLTVHRTEAQRRMPL